MINIEMRTELISNQAVKRGDSEKLLVRYDRYVFWTHENKIIVFVFSKSLSHISILINI